MIHGYTAKTWRYLWFISHDFDVFGIQEGLIHQVKDLVKDGMYTFVGVGRDDGKEAGEHAAVLFKKDRFKLLDSGNYWLSETQDKPSFGWDAQCRRVVLGRS